MKTSGSYQGCSKVLRFTLRQMLRTKANIISLIIFFVVSLASVPFMTLRSGGLFSLESSSDLGQVIWNNETDLPIDFESVLAGDVTFDRADFLEDSTINMENWWTELPYDAAFVDFHMGENGEVETEICGLDATYVTDTVQMYLRSDANAAVHEALLKDAGTDDTALAVLSKSLSVDRESLASYEDKPEVSWDGQYAVQMFYAIIIMMLSVWVTNYVAQSLAEEKSNKLVEFLLVSVKPGALVLGKVLACMAFVVIMVGTMALGYGISYLVTGRFADVSAVTSLGGVRLGSLGAGVFAILLVSLLIAYATYGMMAGIFGSMSSGIEDMQKSITIPMTLIMLSYMGSFISMIPGKTVATVCALVPFLNTFTMPVSYVCGKISLPVVFISWALQLVLLAVIAWFGGKVYESLVMYRGGRVRMRQLFDMAGLVKKRRAEN